MFERDTQAHLERHVELARTDGTPLTHFQRGGRDTFSRPGAQPMSYGRVRLKGGKRKKEEVLVPPEDGIEIVEDPPLTSLEEIIES